MNQKSRETRRLLEHLPYPSRCTGVCRSLPLQYPPEGTPDTSPRRHPVQYLGGSLNHGIDILHCARGHRAADHDGVKWPGGHLVGERLHEIFHDPVDVGEVGFAACGRWCTNAQERDVGTLQHVRRFDAGVKLAEATDWATRVCRPGSTMGLVPPDTAATFNSSGSTPQTS